MTTLSEYEYSVQTSKFFSKRQLGKLKRIAQYFLIDRFKSKMQIFFSKWKTMTKPRANFHSNNI